MVATDEEKYLYDQGFELVITLESDGAEEQLGDTTPIIE